MMMQVQCLPVAKSQDPRWMYSKVPKVSSLWSFDGIPLWCWKPQPFNYHLFAEDLTRGGLASASSAEERKALLNEGVLPRDSSAKDRVCVMCPVRRFLRQSYHRIPYFHWSWFVRIWPLYL